MRLTPTLATLAMAAAASFGAGSAFAQQDSSTLRFEQLHSFNGENPIGPALKASDGRIYGLTCAGGSAGRGTLYRLSQTGSYRVQHSFTRADGVCPYGRMVQATDGYLYGVSWGGRHEKGATVFRADLQGHVSVLHAFGSGDRPAPAISQGPDGNLYGLVSGNEGEYVYRLSLSGDYTNLYLLDPATDGYFAVHGVIAASDGNIYGQTLNGGEFGHGALFRVTPAGVESIMHAFGSGNDVQSPRSGLAEGPDHALYGTSEDGGTNGQGGLFREGLDGTYHVLANYGKSVDPSDGTPVIDSSGNIYVSTQLARLHRFDASGNLTGTYQLPSGEQADLTMTGAHTLYGVNEYGGDLGGGYVFKLKWPGH